MNARVTLLGTALLLVLGRAAAAQSITVNPASAGPLTVTSAVAGQQPKAVVVAGGTYQLRMRKGAGSRIRAQLDTPLPPGTKLFITLVSPGGAAQSAGEVQLRTAPVNVITNIPNRNRNFAARAITYRLVATTAAGVLALRSVQVILALAP